MKGFDIEKQAVNSRKSYLGYIYSFILVIGCLVFILTSQTTSPPPAIPNNSLVQAKTYKAAPSAKHALIEILSVNPIIILEDNESGKLSNLFSSLNIIPEPKFVNLQIHPSYDEITKYLKKFENYVNGDNDFPRVFIDGTPVANYNQLLSLNATGGLSEFLKSHGAGKIKIVNSATPPQVSLTLKKQL